MFIVLAERGNRKTWLDAILELTFFLLFIIFHMKDIT